MEKQWWQDALRVIQYNLQIQDTDRMVPEEIAAKACEAGANAVVINAGGNLRLVPQQDPLSSYQ